MFMNKMILILVNLLLCMVIFSSCSSTDYEYSIVSYDDESRVTIAPPSETSITEDIPKQTFLLKHKTYAYENTDVTIVDVTNETALNYEFKIIGKYLDESGQIIKTETQRFLFPANYQKYFLFKPDISFSKFEYEIDAKETEETCYAKDLSSKFIDFYDTKAPIQTQIWEGNYKFYPTLMAEVAYSFENQDGKYVGFPLTWLIFDENDALLAIFGNIEIFDYSPNPSFSGSSSLVVYQTTNDEIEIEIRKKFEGDIKAILVVGNQDLTLY